MGRGGVRQGCYHTIQWDPSHSPRWQMDTHTTENDKIEILFSSNFIFPPNSVGNFLVPPQTSPRLLKPLTQQKLWAVITAITLEKDPRFYFWVLKWKIMAKNSQLKSIVISTWDSEISQQFTHYYNCWKKLFLVKIFEKKTLSSSFLFLCNQIYNVSLPVSFHAWIYYNWPSQWIAINCRLNGRKNS